VSIPHHSRFSPSRRDLLRSALALGGTAVLGAPLLDRMAHAAAASDRRFIFCFFYGGWDVMSALEPRPKDVYTEARLRETQILPTYDQKSVLSGPAYYDYGKKTSGLDIGMYFGDLEPLLDKCCIVRGVSVELPGHLEGSARFLTGKEPFGNVPKGSSISTHLAAELGQGMPVPNLSASVPGWNVDRDGWAKALECGGGNPGATLLRTLLSAPGSALTNDHEELVADFLRNYEACEDACLPGNRALTLHSAADLREVLKQGRANDFDFSRAEIATVRDADGNVTTSATKANLIARHANLANAFDYTTLTAVQAICTGLSRCVSVNLSDFLDDHGETWGTDPTHHGPKLRSAYSRVARIMNDLEQRPHPSGGTWLDKTTIFVFSEMGRGSMIGGYGGRDHHLATSCLLAGADVRGGKALGKSSDVGMMPTPWDPTTGTTDGAQACIVKPEHILRAMMLSAGITEDVADLRVGNPGSEPAVTAAFTSLSTG
jgi:hypothetical protein